MKVLEIKNNLVKIAYDVEDNLSLSSFVIIEDVNSPYVAQVMNVKADSLSNFAIVKLLFTFDKEGILKNYNGTIPSLKSTVSALPSKELLDVISVDEPLMLGLLAQQNTPLKVDKSILENNLLICSNNAENTSELLNNLTKQVNEKVVVFDFEGQFDFGKKITFSNDFKLPLNYNAIDYIYENDLDDVDAKSRAIIQEIFIDVQDYTKTLPEGYLPFSSFFNVVDAQYKETQIPELALLKNKLLKYKEEGVFAENLKDILSLSIAIDNYDLVVVDLSNVSNVLQKEIMNYAYSVLNGINETIYSFVKLSDSNTTKKLIKKYFEKTNVFTTLICPHEFKYLPELKETAQNIIFFTPMTLQHDFASYNTYLHKLNADEFVVYGAHTQNIPLIVQLSDAADFEDEDEDVTEDNILNSDNDILNSELEISGLNSANQENFENIEEEPENDLYVEEFPEDNVLENSLTEEVFNEEKNSEDESSLDLINEEILIEEENSADGFENYVEADETQYLESEVLSENDEDYISEDEQDVLEPPSHEEMVEQAEKDIDRVLYEKLPEDDIYEEDDIEYELSSEDLAEDEIAEDNIVETLDSPYEQIEPEFSADMTEQEELPIESSNDVDYEQDYAENVLAEDELTDDDLNLIENLADEAVHIDDETDEETPAVPVYPAEEFVFVEAPTFEEGDKVSVPKFGEGVVERMVKYGNKTLCYIMFPNIGKRLIDPAITEITKLG